MMGKRGGDACLTSWSGCHRRPCQRPAVSWACQSWSSGQGAARFAWEEFFYAEHHNPHTQRAYQRAVRQFLGWCEGQGVELVAITPGMVGQFLVGLGGSPAKRNQHLAALRGFFDRLVNRHVCILNPAASVKGVKEQGYGRIGLMDEVQAVLVCALREKPWAERSACEVRKAYASIVERPPS
jgi:site-specific recombinase XerD